MKTADRETLLPEPNPALDQFEQECKSGPSGEFVAICREALRAGGLLADESESE